MGLRARHSYNGSDWQTHRYAVAQAFDTLDQIREAMAMLLSGDEPGTPPPEQTSAMLDDLCSDLASEIDLALADLSVVIQKHLPARWLMVELRAVVRQLPALTHRVADDQDLVPQLADLTERARSLLHRLDQ